MPCSSLRRLLLPGCLAAAVCLQAQAQEVPTPVLAENRNVRPDPLNAQAEVPPALHRSAFAFYRAVGDAPAAGWREANDIVARIGGWRAYAREAQAPAPMVAPPVPAPAASPSPGGHQGHGKP